MNSHQILFSGSGNNLSVEFLKDSEELFSYQEEVSGIVLDELTDLSEEQARALLTGLGLFFPQMPSGKEPFCKITLPEWIGKGKVQFEDHILGLFPGSFNPWHEGHSECLQRSHIEKVLVVPDCNPWKENMGERNLWKEFKELAGQLRETPYALYPGFWGSAEKNPTSSWLPGVSVKEKYLIMGADTFMELHRWKNPDIILGNLTGIKVLGRKVEESNLYLQKKKATRLESRNRNRYLYQKSI